MNKFTFYISRTDFVAMAPTPESSGKKQPVVAAVDDRASMTADFKTMLIDALKVVVSSSAASDRGPYRGRSRSRSRSHSRSRNRSQQRNHTQDRMCWYHYTFGDKAHKCREPCAYKDNRSSSPGNASGSH